MADRKLSLSEEAELRRSLDRSFEKGEEQSPGFKMMGLLAEEQLATGKDVFVKPNNLLKPRLERPQSNVTCTMITVNFKNVEPSPEIGAEKLTWPIPDHSGKHVADLCFYVREVQAFIARFDKVVEPATQNMPEKRRCAMFQKKDIEAVFRDLGLDYVVPRYMDDDFRSIFLEFDALPEKSLVLENDTVTNLVLEQLQTFIETSTSNTSVGKEPVNVNDDSKAGKLQKVVGFFWYATKKSLSFVFDKGIKSGARLLMWFVKNPVYLRMALMAARTIRIVLCIKCSFPDAAPLMMDTLKKHLVDVLVGYNKVIWDCATRIVKCLTTIYKIATGDAGALWDSKDCFIAFPQGLVDTISFYTPQSLKNAASYASSYFSNTVWNFGGFMARAAESILASIGAPMFFQVARVMSGKEAEESDILGLGKVTTQVENLRLAFKTWTPDAFNLNAVIFILDILVSVIDVINISNKAVDIFARVILSRIPVIGALLAAQLKVAAGLTVGLYGKALSPLRIVLIYMRRACELVALRSLILESLNEIYEWVTDLFPCLFRAVSDKLLTILTFGAYTDLSVAPGDKISMQLEPTCCLTPIIRTLQRQFVFGEIDRQQNVRAQDLKKKRSELSWWDYMTSAEGYALIEKEEQNLRRDRRLLETAERKQGGPRLTSYTTQSLGDTVHDSWKTFWSGETKTMQVKSGGIVGIPCVPHYYVQQTHIEGFQFELPFRGTNLRFYLCFDPTENAVVWHLSHTEVAAKLQHLLHFDASGEHAVVPAAQFTQREKVMLSNLPTVLVRLQ